MNVINFEQALKNEKELHDRITDFYHAAIDLSREIALKGMRGETPTEAEMRLMKASALMAISSFTTGVKKP